MWVDYNLMKLCFSGVKHDGFLAFPDKAVVMALQADKRNQSQGRLKKNVFHSKYKRHVELQLDNILFTTPKLWQMWNLQRLVCTM